MKKGIIILILLLTVGAWSAKKWVDRASKSSEELELFLDYSKDYNDNASIFLTESVKEHHDEAFAKAYRMWKLSPVSEFDLSSQYDRNTYYMTLGKILSDKAKAEGQEDARLALIDIGHKFYGLEQKPVEKKKAPTSLQKPTSQNSGDTSKLGKPKLGDKRKIPSSRRRDDQ